MVEGGRGFNRGLGRVGSEKVKNEKPGNLLISRFIKIGLHQNKYRNHSLLTLDFHQKVGTLI